MSIEVRGIKKKFGNFSALRDLSLEVKTGELVALLGPSGCGKTTLLRIIAGLETQDAGSVLFYGEDATNYSVRERGVGFVFQHYALFRHMSVFENVAFGLKVRPKASRPPKDVIEKRVNDLLKLVQLDFLADKLPSQLSGGQRQRAALARALAVEPKVLLLDEPFGALDAQVRKELRRWIRRLHEEVGITSVFVTHDQEEALEVADRIVVMNDGLIEQIGTPLEVFQSPATPFVREFLGHVNIYSGRLAMLLSVNGKRLENFCLLPPGSRGRTLVLKGFKSAGADIVLELEDPATAEPLSAELPQERFFELGMRVGEKLVVKQENF